ncbi:MAG: hypothetical protein IT582_11390 [Opitutaceae bacterium]|nr:hypothetical protein [Opitutaceae bacterium]
MAREAKLPDFVSILTSSSLMRRCAHEALLTIEDDLADVLERRRLSSDLPFNRVFNATLRKGLEAT